MPIKIKEIAHHRNGVCGNGFYVVLFGWRDTDNRQDRDMEAIVFEEAGNCAVLDVVQTYKGNIAFAMGNSWRGDHFEAELRTAIKEYEKAEDEKFK